MRWVPFIAALGMLVAAVSVRPSGVSAAAPARPAAAPTQPAADPFTARVRPLLESRCRPCHFAGGKMYADLPFDRPETIRKLGERLFTRIKDPAEQSIIRSFLASGGDE